MLELDPHHGLIYGVNPNRLLSIMDLNDNDKDSVNAAGGWKFFEESVSKMDERIDKLVNQISTLVEIVSKKFVTLATVKAVEESCVTCGGALAYYNCH
ncbi:hypothetical protein Tco_1098342 [Tanacetum coccineum]